MGTKLFKYMKSHHLEQFFSTGLIRIGTLYEYRNEEAYGKARGDKEEGTHRTALNAPDGMVVDLDQRTPEGELLKKLARKPLSPTKVTMLPGVNVVVRQNSPDCYVYCMSASFKETIMNALNCDSCMEIIDPDGFFRSISHAARHKATFLGSAPVVYSCREANYRSPHTVHPARLKDPGYEGQDEVRAIWRPRKELVSPLMLTVPKAIHYCRVHHEP